MKAPPSRPVLTPQTLDRALLDGRLRAHPGDAARQDAYLPVSTVQSHAANLETLPGGDLGCVWFGGTQEGVGDISIYFSRLGSGSDRWSEPMQLSDDSSRSEQNPILFTTPAGQLWLLYTAQLAGNQDTAEIRRRISTDDGRSWGPVETLFPATEQGGVFVRQPVVVTRTGRWLLGTFHCLRRPGEKWVGDLDTSAVMISDDQGGSWREVSVPDSTGCVHMNIVELADASLYAVFRSRWADHIYQSRSDDDGDTWTPPTATDLPNNNSSIQQQRLADDRLALIYNHSNRLDATQRRTSLYDEIDDEGLVEPPAPAGDKPAGDKPLVPTGPVASADPSVATTRHTAFWGAPRAPMTLAFSGDDGRSWQPAGNLDDGDGYCLTNNSRDGLNREFSYPAVHQSPDGTLNLAYTCFRQTIKYVRVPATWSER